MSKPERMHVPVRGFGFEARNLFHLADALEDLVHEELPAGDPFSHAYRARSLAWQLREGLERHTRDLYGFGVEDDRSLMDIAIDHVRERVGRYLRKSEDEPEAPPAPATAAAADQDLEGVALDKAVADALTNALYVAGLAKGIDLLIDELPPTSDTIVAMVRVLVEKTDSLANELSTLNDKV